MTLTREQIERMWAELESGDALPRIEDLREVFDLASRALPLPEGEAHRVADDLRDLARVADGDGRATTMRIATVAASTIERQAAIEVERNATILRLLERATVAEASLAAVERERDKWREVAGETEDECEKAEASLASARREIEEAAGFLRYLTRGLASPTADKVKAWLERVWASSPRQEET